MNTLTSLNITTTATGHAQLNYHISLSTGEKTIVMMTIDDFNQQYYELVKSKIGSVLETVISNLIKSRDYLGLQLNLEFGNIDESEYEQLELAFVPEQKSIAPHDLKNDIDMLMGLTNKVYNSEEISTMFNCSVEIAENALGILLLEKDPQYGNDSEGR